MAESSSGAAWPAARDDTAGALPELISPVQEPSFPDEWYALADPEHFWIQWRLRAALVQIRHVGIPVDRPLRALEIGAGAGVLRDQIESRTSWTVDMTDLRLEALICARRGRGRKLYYDVREEREAFLEAYDVVMLFDVLEHVEETGPFLRSVLRHLKPDGRLLLNVPALEGLRSVYDDAAGHLRRYDTRSLVAEFEGTGLVIEDRRYWGLSLIPLLMLRKVLLGRRAPDAAVIRRGFRPPGRAFHAALRALMRLETVLCPRVPLGTSLLLVGRKASGSPEA